MSVLIEHRFEVNAPISTLWQVISDFDSYAQWNPFIVGCECDLAVGNSITMQVVLGEGKARRAQTEYISELEQGSHFAYTSPKNPTVLLRSYRCHTLTELEGGRSEYYSRFELHGWLVPILGLIMNKPLQWGFDAMSRGIVQRAEALSENQEA